MENNEVQHPFLLAIISSYVYLTLVIFCIKKSSIDSSEHIYIEATHTVCDNAVKNEMPCDNTFQ